MVAKIKGKKRKIRRGWNPFLESTAQPPKKRKSALAPNIDQEQSPYYRNNFQSRRTDTPTPVTADAHAGLRTADWPPALLDPIVDAIPPR
jgi:hypothetical protein